MIGPSSRSFGIHVKKMLQALCSQESADTVACASIKPNQNSSIYNKEQSQEGYSEKIEKRVSSDISEKYYYMGGGNSSNFFLEKIIKIFLLISSKI